VELIKQHKTIEAAVKAIDTKVFTISDFPVMLFLFVVFLLHKNHFFGSLYCV